MLFISSHYFHKRRNSHSSSEKLILMIGSCVALASSRRWSSARRQAGRQGARKKAFNRRVTGVDAMRWRAYFFFDVLSMMQT